MQESSLVEFTSFFSKAVHDVIQGATGLSIHTSATYQKLRNVRIAGDIGSFVSFRGDYDGIFIMNFSGAAALAIVTAYLKKMGMPDNDIPINHTSEDVRNNIGEMVNQIVGKSRTLIEKEYDLASKANIPSVVPITTPIGLILETSNNTQQECVRVSMSIKTHPFYLELSMEPVTLIKAPGLSPKNQ